MNEKVVGILGGMGPEATCEIFKRIISYTEAKSDSEHLRIIIDNNPKIPDRTKAILHKGKSPVEEMVKSAINIQKAGADFIIIPCMTAHYFIKEVQCFINIPILNGIELTNKYLYERFEEINNIGLIATSGTLATNLFQQYLKDKKIVIPMDDLQHEVMDIIYGEKGIKAGNTSSQNIKRINNVIQSLKEYEGIGGVIAGCTEIGLTLKQSDVDLPLIDPLTVLAMETVKFAKNKIQ